MPLGVTTSTTPTARSTGAHPSVRRRAGRPAAAKAAETWGRILGAAREVFSELGYEGATLQAVAVRADLSRPAVHYHFPNKRVLYREVVKQTIAGVITAGRDQSARHTTLLGQLSAFVAAAVQVGSEDRSAAAFLVTSVLESRRHPELRDSDGEALALARAFLSAAVTGAIARGELTADTDATPLVELLLGLLWGIGFHLAVTGSPRELEEIIEQLHRLLAGNLWHTSDAGACRSALFVGIDSSATDL